MDYTREPVIETVITPKEGCKLVVRSSKTSAQEEFFVDAVEVVSFGSALFFRSTERPKSFLVPVTDYEILEVREARMILKQATDRSAIKIGGGKEANVRSQERDREPLEKMITPPLVNSSGEEEGEESSRGGDKKKDRKRSSRRRKGRGEREDVASKEITEIGEDGEIISSTSHADGEEPPTAKENTIEQEKKPADIPLSPEVLASLLMPPPVLIADTIARYKENGLFKEAFYSKEELELRNKEEKALLVENAVALVESSMLSESFSEAVAPVDMLEMSHYLKDDDDLWHFQDNEGDQNPKI